MNLLLVRPQEVLAAIQALAQAYADYSSADANRAQFRLYRALGRPAEMLLAGDRADPQCEDNSGAPLVSGE